MNHRLAVAAALPALWLVAEPAGANECKSAVVVDCLKELTGGGWRQQFVAEPNPKMQDASVEYEVWMRDKDAMFCIRRYWRGNIEGSMNCSSLKRVSN